MRIYFGHIAEFCCNGDAFLVPADGLWVSGLQRFDKQPEYTEVNPGEDVLMTCKVFNKKGTCSWQKDNKVSHSTKLPANHSTLQQVYAALKRKEAVGKASKIFGHKC